MTTTTRQQFAGETFRGNWQRRDCFIWFEQPEHSEDFGLWILSHRDSGLIDQSNGAAIRKRLAKYEACGDVIFFGCSHWLVGSTDEMAVRVCDLGTTTETDAFKELKEIVEAIDQYPILDESDYSEREYESAIQGIDCMAIGDIQLPTAAPDDWKEQVYSWLGDNEPNELENTDDRGAFPSAESIDRALTALGIAHVSTLKRRNH
jgi:hypothetical protein